MFEGSKLEMLMEYFIIEFILYKQHTSFHIILYFQEIVSIECFSEQFQITLSVKLNTSRL